MFFAKNKSCQCFGKALGSMLVRRDGFFGLTKSWIHSVK
ncbi:hypothetical protein ENHAE0001_0343 [Enhydrobacter aerosaccus SK60]|nr:hypothetical protein ENHAE0001_0343 [Enhydrobacter aerosaccus SK60]